MDFCIEESAKDIEAIHSRALLASNTTTLIVAADVNRVALHLKIPGGTFYGGSGVNDGSGLDVGSSSAFVTIDGPAARAALYGYRGVADFVHVVEFVRST